MRTLLFCLFSVSALAGFAQTAPSMVVPPNAVAQLEDVKESTKQVAFTKNTKGKLQAEARPEVNRLLVLAADDFVRITTAGKPTREAYLRCLDNDLARLSPLITDEQDRRQMEKSRDYMVRVDDQLMCKNMRCRKRFEIPSAQSIVFI